MAGKKRRITLVVIENDYHVLLAWQARAAKLTPSKPSFSALAHQTWFPHLAEQKVRRKPSAGTGAIAADVDADTITGSTGTTIGL